MDLDVTAHFDIDVNGWKIEFLDETHSDPCGTCGSCHQLYYRKNKLFNKIFLPYMQIMCNPSLYSFQQTTVLSWETVHVINKAKDLIFYISFIQTWTHLLGENELLIGISSRIGGVVPGFSKNTDLTKQSINTYQRHICSTIKYTQKEGLTRKMLKGKSEGRCKN